MAATQMDSLPNTGVALRRANRQKILSLLSRSDAMLRVDVCEVTGLTGAGLSRIVRELIDAGLVTEKVPEVRRSVAGRRSAKLSINPTGAYVLGATIAANRVSVALVNAAHENLGQTDFEPAESLDAKKTIRKLANAARRLVETTMFDRQRLVGIGVGIAVPSTDSVVVDGTVTSRMIGWRNVPVAKLLSHALHLPVQIEARANALLRAEVSHLNEQCLPNLFLINNGIGIGSAALLDGKILGSEDRAIARLSHVTAPASKIKCECGRVGCLERSASGAAVVRALNGAAPEQNCALPGLAPALSDAVARADAGDKDAKRAFRKAGCRMASGIDTVQALFEPDRIILAGETGRQNDYVAGVRDGLRKLATPIAAEQLTVSDVTSAEASACVALDAFVFSQDLNIAQLRAA